MSSSEETSRNCRTCGNPEVWKKYPIICSVKCLIKYHAGYSVIFGMLGLVTVAFCFIFMDIILFTFTTNILLETPFVGTLLKEIPSSLLLDIFLTLTTLFSLSLIVLGIIGLLLRFVTKLLVIEQNYETEIPLLEKKFGICSLN
ncbi:MAG: hypothetical protein ACTSQ9_05260, partial [Candidatus Hodarchaeales archaeon]